MRKPNNRFYDGIINTIYISNINHIILLKLVVIIENKEWLLCIKK